MVSTLCQKVTFECFASLHAMIFLKMSLFIFNQSERTRKPIATFFFPRQCSLLWFAQSFAWLRHRDGMQMKMAQCKWFSSRQCLYTKWILKPKLTCTFHFASKSSKGASSFFVHVIGSYRLLASASSLVKRWTFQSREWMSRRLQAGKRLRILF